MDKALITYLLTHGGRFPSIEDERKPWTYKGWMRLYVQLAEAHPDVPARWAYIARVHELKAWPDEPIPQLRITQADPEATKNLQDAITIAAEHGKHGYGWEAFRRLVRFMAFGLGVADEAPEMADSVHEALYRHLNLDLMLLAPWDYLGAIAAEKHSGGWNPNAFYPTPHPVCEAMARMTIADAKGDTRGMSVLDPCVGTGRMLLHMSNHCMFLYGQDIDPLMCEITKINGALYAPWMIAPPPTRLLTNRKRINRRPPPRRKRRA